MTRKSILAGAILCGVGIFILLRSHDDAPPRVAYQGDSAGLKASVVVPTLSSALPTGKSVLWCSSFQMAWNRLKTDVVKAPVQIKGVEKIADALNAAPQSEADLSPDEYFAAAGFVKDGIVQKINSEMARKFPRLRVPSVAGDSELVAFACLAAKAKFTEPFRNNPDEFYFYGSNGVRCSVSSFGIRRDDHTGDWKMREQVEILHYLRKSDSESDEFIVDLSKTSTLNQVVLACVPPKASLAETLAYIEEQIKKNDASDDDDTFKHAGELLVPNMSWYIEHAFKEITGADKALLNAGFTEHYVSSAMQSIDFQFDRTGAEVISKAVVATAVKSESPVQIKSPPQLIFDHPFLLLMKKRGAAHPFFVMWVDNAELLSKK